MYCKSFNLGFIMWNDQLNYVPLIYIMYRFVFRSLSHRLRRWPNWPPTWWTIPAINHFTVIAWLQFNPFWHRNILTSVISSHLISPESLLYNSDNITRFPLTYIIQYEFSNFSFNLIINVFYRPRPSEKNERKFTNLYMYLFICLSMCVCLFVCKRVMV